jgi:NAD(P)H-dependent FMN reductase
MKGHTLMKLLIVIGTVRQGRTTPKLAKWIENNARTTKDIEVEVVDLKDYPMPFFEEPVSPRYNPDRKYNATVKKWLDKVAWADAYIMVTPEYNHSIPGVLKNALDHIDWQADRKPSTIASHGTVGGARAAMHLKEILSESRTVPIQNHIAFQGMENIDEQGNLNEELKIKPYGPQATLEAALAELKWYSDALSTARSKDIK